MNTMDSGTPSGMIGVVLAGGRSSRMGRSKALLRLEGRPLVEHMLGLLHAVPGVAEAVISGSVEGYDGIPDPAPFSGPAEAVRALRTRFTGHDLLIVPVDMPFLTPGLLTALAASSHGACYGQSPLPLYLPASAPLGEGASLKALTAPTGLSRLPLPPDHAHVLANLNTPEDWAKRISA